MTIQVRSNEKPITPPPAATAVETPIVETAPEAGLGESKETPPSAPDAQASEQNKASDSETEAKEEPEKQGEQKEETAEEEREPKKKGGFQRRIDKLSSQKAQVQQELDYWKSMAIKNAAGSPKVPASQPADFNPQATQGKPKPESFETHTEYVEALTDWKTEEKLKERDQKAVKERLDQEQAKIVNSYTERMKSFASKTPDFQEVISEVDHVPLTPALRDIILNSENGPELAYELAKLPGEYERIARLPPLACAREMGKFEARLSPSKGSLEKTEKKITQAPKPLTPVGTGGKGSIPKSIFDPSLSQTEYEALRREQIKQRRRA